MPRLFIAAAAVAALASCKPTAQVTLSVEPGFYPSAIAHERLHDRVEDKLHHRARCILGPDQGAMLVPSRRTNAIAPLE